MYIVANGHVIEAIGLTKDQAIANYHQALGNLPTDDDYEEIVDHAYVDNNSQLYVKECTKALYEQVQREGGCISWEDGASYELADVEAA
jgi:hypothetical protein